MLDDEKKSRPDLKSKSNNVVYGAYMVHEITCTHMRLHTYIIMYRLVAKISTGCRIV